MIHVHFHLGPTARDIQTVFSVAIHIALAVRRVAHTTSIVDAYIMISAAMTPLPQNQRQLVMRAALAAVVWNSARLSILAGRASNALYASNY